MDPTKYTPSHTRNSKSQIKNRAAAPVQITAEQIVREAAERVEPEVQRTKEVISDVHELEEYRLRKRKEFEDAIRTGRGRIGNFLKYAQFEATQGDYRRARSVFERALAIDARSPQLYAKYAEMEMSAGFVQHARNVLDRAVTLLPRNDALWLKFVHLEELLGNVAGARTVYQRWLEWTPGREAFQAFLRFELRYDELDRARAVCEDLVVCLPDAESWLVYARTEDQLGDVERCRAVYERALAALGDGGLTEKFFLALGEFEERQKEDERAKVIYEYAMNTLKPTDAVRVQKRFVAFMKQRGSRASIEHVLLDKRAVQYETALAATPDAYDLWLDYARMFEETGDSSRVREVYERAIGTLPPLQTKEAWSRYIFLYYFYAAFEELVARDAGRARQVLATALKVVPHAAFSFPELWIAAAELELRQHNLPAARKVFGHALGAAPDEAVFLRYFEIEYELLNFDRCRTILSKLVEHAPASCAAWLRYAAFETGLAELERARALYEIAVDMPSLDQPELLWKAYIDFEIAEAEPERAYALFERLLERTSHAKVFSAYARYAASAGDVARARQVFGRADEALKQAEAKDDRAALLSAWEAVEAEHGDDESRAAIAKRMPQKIKRRRKVLDGAGNEVGWEEYVDFMFPDTAARQSNLKLLEAARLWAERQAAERAAAPQPAAQYEAAPQEEPSDEASEAR